MVKTRKTSGNFFQQYRHYIIPSSIGGVIAWLASGDLLLGIIVFGAVWGGNWIGKELIK